MANVIFRYGTKAQYDALSEHDSSTLYWLSDVQEIWKGDTLYGKGAEATAQASGLMSAADKAKLDELSGSTVAGLSPVDATIIMESLESGDRTIRVGVSPDEGNILSVHENGLFASVPDIGTLQESLDILNGTGEGSIQKKAEDAAAAAINEFAASISDDGVVNTFKELVDYVAEHGSEAADMAADINAVQGVINSLPNEFMSEITAVSRTETTNVAEIRIAVKQADGTYSMSDQHGALTLISAGAGADGISGAGLMSLADKQKLDAINVDSIEAIENSLVWGEL